MVYDVEVMYLGKKFFCSWCLDLCYLREKKKLLIYFWISGYLLCVGLFI